MKEIYNDITREKDKFKIEAFVKKLGEDLLVIFPRVHGHTVG